MVQVGLKQRLLGGIVRQFGYPRGWRGRLVGRIMATRPSNRQRSVWAVEQLDLQPGDRVLEIGFGPGLAIEAMVAIVTDGLVCGLDRSEVMLGQASRRNRRAIEAGRVDLRHGSVEALPDFGAPFDKMLAINNLAFWPEPATRLKELHDRLRPGGLLAVAHQPRCPGATADTSAAAAQELLALLDAAGFVDLRVETLPLDPPAVCVVSARATAPR